MSLGGIDTARYFRRKEAERLDAMMARNRKRRLRRAGRVGRDESRIGEELDETESDLGRALLLTVSLHNVLKEKGLLVPADLAEAARDVDLLDGLADGRLDPSAVRSEDDATT